MVNIMSGKRSSILGVGINDADYIVSGRQSGKRVLCDIYQIWLSMLSRCYSEKFLYKYPTYAGCSVCEEWLTFSNFKNWVDKQLWKGMKLDKDIIKIGNKVYCPSACAFVSHETNTFIVDHNNESERMVGVNFDKRRNSIYSRCRNPFTKKSENLGVFPDYESAHFAWKAKKHEHALKLADLQTDPRVAQALRTRYL